MVTKKDILSKKENDLQNCYWMPDFIDGVYMNKIRHDMVLMRWIR